jgi:hypothetical protein
MPKQPQNLFANPMSNQVIVYAQYEFYQRMLSRLRGLHL